MQTVLPLLSPPLRARVARLPEPVLGRLQEIRIREGRPLEVGWGLEYGFVGDAGEPTRNAQAAYRPTRSDCSALLEALTQHSLYTFEEELKRGYITVAGGHRVGLAGRVLIEGGRVRSVKDVAGFNIRLAKEWKNAGARLLPQLLDPVSGEPLHTLIVSPPCQGKTTMIRDLARLLSEGAGGASDGLPLRPGARRSYKVGVVDERSEIAASVKGVPTFDLGPRTDVLDGCPKAEGMMMMIRSMSPEVLVVDEIGRAEDAEAVHEALHAGIAVLATAHGRDVREIRQRPILRELLAARIFRRIAVLRRHPLAGIEAEVFDEDARPIEPRRQLGGGGR